MKKDEMINLLTENALNERLDKLILQNTKYIEIREKVHSLLDELERIDSSKSVQSTIDRYDSAVHEESALYAYFTYQQGLKDMFNLIMSLQNRGESIEEWKSQI